MTKEEVLNSGEWRLTLKIIKKEFPFIKDMVLKYDDVNKYNRLIFVNLIINPWEMAETYHLKVSRYIQKYAELPYEAGFLTGIFDSDSDEKILKKINKEIDDVADGVHESAALPVDYKLKDKKISISNFVVVGPKTPEIQND